MNLYIHEGRKKTTLQFGSTDPDQLLESARQYAQARGKIIRDFDVRYSMVGSRRPLACHATIS